MLPLAWKYTRRQLVVLRKSVSTPHGRTAGRALCWPKQVAKHGVKVNLKQGASSAAQQYPQLLHGQVDVALGTGRRRDRGSGAEHPCPGRVRRYHGLRRLQGKPNVQAIVGKNSSVRRFKDLEGKTVGVNSLKGNWEVALLEAVKLDGGDPTKVKRVAIAFPDQLAALRQGRVHAVSTFQPFAAQMEAAGFKYNGDPQADALNDQNAASTVAYMSEGAPRHEPRRGEGLRRCADGGVEDREQGSDEVPADRGARDGGPRGDGQGCRPRASRPRSAATRSLAGRS